MTNKAFDATFDKVEAAKESAVSLIQQNSNFDAMDLFYNDNLEYIEKGIKSLNDYSNKTWLLSSILIFTLVYDKGLYTESGLTWNDYMKVSRERLGLDQRDVSEQLSAARFFIQNHDELMRQGFNPIGSNRKLARAELATELCEDVHEVIKHLVNDSWKEFNEWYSSFKAKKALPTEIKNNDIDFKDSKIYIKGKPAVTFSKDVPDEYRDRLEKYMSQIVGAIRQGYEPAIVPVYDEKEARVLVNLRDKYRQKK